MEGKGNESGYGDGGCFVLLFSIRGVKSFTLHIFQPAAVECVCVVVPVCVLCNLCRSCAKKQATNYTNSHNLRLPDVDIASCFTMLLLHCAALCGSVTVFATNFLTAHCKMNEHNTIPFQIGGLHMI